MPEPPEGTGWLEQRLTELENQLSSQSKMNEQILSLLTTMTQNPHTVTLTPEQMTSLRDLSEQATGKTADKVDALLLRLEKQGLLTPLQPSPKGNSVPMNTPTIPDVFAGVDIREPNNPAPAPPRKQSKALPFSRPI